MSTVIAMIYRGEICLASDKMARDHETGQVSESEVKQIVINDNIAIGFTGSGNIAEVIMDTLNHPINSDKVSKLTFKEISLVLDDIYQSHTAENNYPDKETRHVTALIVGINESIPEIVCWDSSKGATTFTYDHPGNFTAFVLPPYDMSREDCNEILLEIARTKLQLTSFVDVAVDYFKTVSSVSKYVSESFTCWTHTYPQ